MDTTLFLIAIPFFIAAYLLVELPKQIRKRRKRQKEREAMYRTIKGVLEP
jgi:hypothetical protein